MDTTSALLLAAGAFLAGLVLGRRARLRVPPAPKPAPIDPKALELARRVLPLEGKIGAIHAYRQATGVGLRDATVAVDTIDAP